MDKEKNNPCALGEYDKDTGFPKGVVVVNEDGTTTIISEEEKMDENREGVVKVQAILLSLRNDYKKEG